MKYLIPLFLVLISCHQNSKEKSAYVPKITSIEKMSKESDTLDTELVVKQTNLDSGKNMNKEVITEFPLHPIYKEYNLDTLRNKIGEITRIDSSSYKPYHVIQFHFREQDPNKPWPYGTGMVLIDKEKSPNQVIWTHLEYGDFGAHSYSWIDFDKDGDKDVFILAGYEDVFKSQLYVNQVELNQDEPFKSVFNNDIAYCALIDLDNDGTPEILNQVEKKEEQGYDYNPELEYELPQSSQEKLIAEYDRIIGRFDDYNFNYNMPNVYKLFSLSINAKVQILTVRESGIVDVSNRFSEHFCLRAEILKTIESAGSEIKPWIEILIKENENKCK